MAPYLWNINAVITPQGYNVMAEPCDADQHSITLFVYPIASLSVSLPSCCHCHIDLNFNCNLAVSLAPSFAVWLPCLNQFHPGDILETFSLCPPGINKGCCHVGIRWHSESSNHRLIPSEEFGSMQLMVPGSSWLPHPSTTLLSCLSLCLHPRDPTAGRSLRLASTAASLASSDFVGSPRSHGRPMGGFKFLSDRCLVCREREGSASVWPAIKWCFGREKK